jgi:hypothetical protein
VIQGGKEDRKNKGLDEDKKEVAKQKTGGSLVGRSLPR